MDFSFVTVAWHRLVCGWVGAEYCDQGNLDQAVTSGRFNDDLESVYMCAAQTLDPCFCWAKLLSV